MSSTPVLAPKGSPAVAPVLVPGHSRLSLRRAMAMLVLPASIVPVIFLGRRCCARRSGWSARPPPRCSALRGHRRTTVAAHR